VPCKLGADGVEEIIKIKLLPEEKTALKGSLGAVKKLCKDVDRFLAQK